MLHSTEKKEKDYFRLVSKKLFKALQKIERTIQNHSKKILDIKKYMWENSSQLDQAERAANRIIAYDEVSLGEDAVKARERIKKMLSSPYFGRIDFLPEGENTEQNIYIGIHSFTDPEKGNLIYDWRAPVASMFYDFEKGMAHYHAPAGTISGTILLKRQYKIRDGNWEFMIENSLNIDDEILQKELSKNSDEKMKHIAATIQREQNQIIRDETTNVLIIQGAAGSGKTSIALHRVAFLLYRFKGKLKSDNIMILSPNKVFGSFISDVLPELGEENILQIGFEELTESILGNAVKFQTFAEQVEEIIVSKDKNLINRIKFLSSDSLVSELDSYLQYAESQYFQPMDLDISGFHIGKEEIQEKYRNCKDMPMKQRFEKIAADFIVKVKNNTEKKLDAKTVRLVKKNILAMFTYPDAYSLYTNFYDHIGQAGYFPKKKRNYLDYCDVFPYIYIKFFFDGIPDTFKAVKHLLVDEMQDYTPIQYAILSKLFSCKMTILGDHNQSVNPYGSSAADKIAPYFNGCSCLELKKSYRSTFEIMELAQSIQRNRNLIPMERHGKRPGFYACQTVDGELEQIGDLILEFNQSDFKSLGILCKSQQQADQLYQTLSAKHGNIGFINFESTALKERIVITTIHMSKGLEFDQIIIPDASQVNYATALEKRLLYIAVTRAMHRLDLTFMGEKSKFLTSC